MAHEDNVRHPCGLDAPIACADDDNNATAQVLCGFDAPITKPGDCVEDGDRHPCGLDAPIACAGADNGATAEVTRLAHLGSDGII